MYLQCPLLILAPLEILSKGSTENKPASFIFLIFDLQNPQNSNLSFKYNNWKWGETHIMK